MLMELVHHNGGHNNDDDENIVLYTHTQNADFIFYIIFTVHYKIMQLALLQILFHLHVKPLTTC